MDLVWLVLGLVVVAILAITISVALPFYRKRGIKQARASLNEVPEVISRIDKSLEPFVCESKESRQKVDDLRGGFKVFHLLKVHFPCRLYS